VQLKPALDVENEEKSTESAEKVVNEAQAEEEEQVLFEQAQVNNEM
jgi:hypothetical protein